ncbi:MAG: hypothetical protein CFE21_06625 [Bacteroidetes bacterium B1(2017)]|nr:MAG: hypothetical protein CFE21_06625 [Bacteroidetes bacterium B1(2017)]
MSTNNPKASGLLFTLTFIGLFFVSLIVVLAADIEVSSFFEDQVNSQINTQVQSKIGSVGASVSSGKSLNNSLFYEFGSQK